MRRFADKMAAFLRDRRGNYGMLFAISMVPILGGAAIAVDYSEASSQRQATLGALDAAGIATARYIVSGAKDDEIRAYARKFFDANLSGIVDPADVTFSVTLPSNEAGGGTLKLAAQLNYKPLFYNVFDSLLSGEGGAPEVIEVSAGAEIRLKNTLEVALVLDNSGSMKDLGKDSGQKRIDLLKVAAKQLVDTLAAQALLIKQVDRPVQFSLVPFAASVNVGPQNAAKAWMDVNGLSPIHHENFDWTTMSSGDKRAVQTNGIWRKAGAGWGDEQTEILSRFTLYKDMKHVSSRNGPITRYASWQGCVEARPYPYNNNDATPSAFLNDVGIVSGDPATLFVPMFAPDEPGDRWATPEDSKPDNEGAANNWWNDGTEAGGVVRLKNMRKYFDVKPYDPDPPQGAGPNYSCTTGPITELVDVSKPEGLAAIKSAIDKMSPNGGTNVPEGLAWGWRTVSSTEPFTGGRPETERGNDKVVIVLTDGANTYYTPGSLGLRDPADSKSTYSSYGYMKPGYNGTGTARLFMGASGAIGQYNYSNANYTNALNEQMAKLCENAKEAKVLLMTVALDLNSGNTTENAQIEALRKCASESRFRRDPADPSKPAKLFWNATGGNLSEKFKEIADELSNLRIVG